MSDNFDKNTLQENPEDEYVRRIYPDDGNEKAKEEESEGEEGQHGKQKEENLKTEKQEEEELYRCEIIANNSVEDDILEVLEEVCPGILYTILPSVHGRGKNDRKLSTATWPETNFVLFAYVTKDELAGVRRAVRAVKETFHGEGIKLFIMKGCLPEDF